MQNEDVIQHASSEEISDWYELLYFETYEYIRSIKMIWRKKSLKHDLRVKECLCQIADSSIEMSDLFKRALLKKLY